MVSLSKKGNTSVNDTCNGKVVTLYNTKIVIFNDTRILLNTGSFNTSTTRQRMNQASQEFNLGFTVFQKKGNLFVTYKGDTIKFVNCIELTR